MVLEHAENLFNVKKFLSTVRTAPDIFCRCIYSIANDTFSDSTKFKAFADDKSDVAKIIIPLLDRIENIVGKGENAGYQHFLLLSQCFQNASS